jgi:mRNA interferase HicA
MSSGFHSPFVKSERREFAPLCTIEEVKASELKRKLESMGCTMEEGTKHWIVSYKGEKTTIPRHPSKEIRTGTLNGILKQLGLRLR